MFVVGTCFEMLFVSNISHYYPHWQTGSKCVGIHIFRLWRTTFALFFAYSFSCIYNRHRFRFFCWCGPSLYFGCVDVISFRVHFGNNSLFERNEITTISSSLFLSVSFHFHYASLLLRTSRSLPITKFFSIYGRRFFSKFCASTLWYEMFGFFNSFGPDTQSHRTRYKLSEFICKTKFSCSSYIKTTSVNYIFE